MVSAQAVQVVYLLTSQVQQEGLTVLVAVVAVVR
jgi:hypothetical protein